MCIACFRVGLAGRSPMRHRRRWAGWGAGPNPRGPRLSQPPAKAGISHERDGRLLSLAPTSASLCESVWLAVVVGASRTIACGTDDLRIARDHRCRCLAVPAAATRRSRAWEPRQLERSGLQRVAVSGRASIDPHPPHHLPIPSPKAMISST